MHCDHEQLQQAIIGSLLLWPDKIDDVASKIKVDDFYQEKYRAIYRYLLEKDGGDFVTTANALAGRVNPSEMILWMDMQVTSALLPRYCDDLKEAATKIRLRDAAGEIQHGFSEMSSSQMIERIESAIASTVVGASNDPVPASAAVKEAFRAMKTRFENQGAIHGIPYGFENLDAATCGMHRGELIVVAGRPSMGKSAFAGNILENVCRSGKTGLMFSLEMDTTSVINRMLASVGHIDYGRIRSGKLADVEWGKMSRANEVLHRCSMFIDDTPGISLREIRSKARRQKRNGLDLIIVDYLQIMTVSARENRTTAIGEVSRGLKQLARELEVPIILLSQLNRGVDARSDKKPAMSDLRDSGEIEQDADVILFPFRPAAYCQKCKDRVDSPDHNLSEHQTESEIIIEKQRNGERNISVPVVWLGAQQRFVDLSIP